ncbi:hypothetical protein E4U55_006436 [Claviceps digitariae]|nr:hypothetical protein E4U55_006436 [Claviceps digitariae]
MLTASALSSIVKVPESPFRASTIDFKDLEHLSTKDLGTQFCASSSSCSPSCSPPAPPPAPAPAPPPAPPPSSSFLLVTCDLSE